MGYRNQCYRSVLTGSKAPPLAKPWMEIMDDSLESFRKLHMDTGQPEALRKTA